MNIVSLIEIIKNFEKEIVNSGFTRDITEYLTNINQPQNKQNLPLLKDIGEKIARVLTQVYEGDLPVALSILLPDEVPPPFTKFDHLSAFNKIIDDPNIDTNTFYTALQAAIQALKTQIDSNSVKMKSLNDTFLPYVKTNIVELASNEHAIVSVIFNDKFTVTNLKSFSKSIFRWNQVLHIYSQILSSTSPEDVELIDIHNGSIDVVVNLNIDLAVNLAELMKIGFSVFGGYLLYKSRMAEIVKTYYGNKGLEADEKKRELAMLENIGIAIESKIKEQHTKALKKDTKINLEVIDKKIEQIKNVITDHVIKGNEIKLLAYPKEKEELQNEDSELKKESLMVKNSLRTLPDKEKDFLLSKYAMSNDDLPAES